MSWPQSLRHTAYDYVVIGSGFGGSVSAMRLVEKGYRVLVLERGKRYRDAQFARSNWNVFKYLWSPALRCFGILQISVFRQQFCQIVRGNVDSRGRGERHRRIGAGRASGQRFRAETFAGHGDRQNLNPIFGLAIQLDPPRLQHEQAAWRVALPIKCRTDLGLHGPRAIRHTLKSLWLQFPKGR